MVDGLAEYIGTHRIKRRGGKLVLYKAVSKEWGSLYVRMKLGGNSGSRGISGVYRPGTVVKARSWDNNPNSDCGEGLHVCTLRCALDYRDLSYFASDDTHRRLVEVLVDPEDVVCVPRWGSKIRCKKLVVVAEVDGRGRRR